MLDGQLVKVGAISRLCLYFIEIVSLDYFIYHEIAANSYIFSVVL